MRGHTLKLRNRRKEDNGIKYEGLDKEGMNGVGESGKRDRRDVSGGG